MMLYGITMSASVEESVTAKAAVFVGSDFSTLVGDSFAIELPFEHTVVHTLPRVTLEPGPLHARMLGIDTSTFPDVALWKEGFASEPLAELMRRLEGGSPDEPNVIVSGTSLADGTAISVSGDDIPINVVATTESFPGMANEGPTIIMSDKSYNASVARMSIYSQPNLWVEGDPEKIEAALTAAGANTSPPRTVEQVLQTPEIQSALGILGVLAALGAAAGIIVVIGLLLYLQARHRSTVVSSALTRRMGLGRRAEFRAWFLGDRGRHARLVRGRGDRCDPHRDDHEPAPRPAPDLAPGPSLIVPSTIVVFLGVAVVLIAVVSAWRIQRGIDRTDIAEEMRA